jgi:superfamily II DNA helicase RecQ
MFVCSLKMYIQNVRWTGWLIDMYASKASDSFASLEMLSLQMIDQSSPPPVLVINLTRLQVMAMICINEVDKLAVIQCPYIADCNQKCRQKTSRCEDSRFVRLHR